ncbi:unannotated protein [freshwater metagenome]|uniref:Unannotated protein n=1 Tax=freshwater metagenome TaxID=449393 RepID=A0A6J6EYT0_9ZZZZ|nr:hypothetical protein [Actinomycetota bacterium]
MNIAGEKFGSPDDLSIATMQNNPEGLFQTSWNTAMGQGRIHQFAFFVLNNWALSEQHQLITPIIKFSSVMLIFLLFSYLISTIYGGLVSLFTSLLLISTVVTTGEYNAINSFPLWFTLGIISFLFSLILFNKLLQKYSLGNLILFAISFFIALFSSEVFFLLLLTYPLLQLKMQGESEWRIKLTSALKYYLLIMAITVSYFLVYLAFKLNTRGTYEGASLSFDQPLRSLLSTGALSVGQANVYGIKRQIIDGGIYFNPLIATIFVLVISLLFWSLKKNTLEIRTIRFKEIFAVILLALLGNVILGFTVKYSIIGLVYPLYVNSLISYLFIILATSLLILKFAGNKWFSFLAIFSIAIFGYISFLDQINQYEKLKVNQNVFKVVDCIIGDPNLSSFLKSDVVSNDIAVLSKAYDYNYFGERFRTKTGSDYFFHRNLKENIATGDFSTINLYLLKEFAAGSISNHKGNDLIDKIDFRLDYDLCRFELINLTPK